MGTDEAYRFYAAMVLSVGLTMGFALSLSAILPWAHRKVCGKTYKMSESTSITKRNIVIKLFGWLFSFVLLCYIFYASAFVSLWIVSFLAL